MGDNERDSDDQSDEEADIDNLMDIDEGSYDPHTLTKSASVRASEREKGVKRSKFIDDKDDEEEKERNTGNIKR